MLDIQKTDNDNLLIVVCEDGNVMIDKRVYEQKLGTLLSCTSKEQVFNLAQSSQSYLENLYHDNIETPMYL